LDATNGSTDETSTVIDQEMQVIVRDESYADSMLSVDARLCPVVIIHHVEINAVTSWLSQGRRRRIYKAIEYNLSTCDMDDCMIQLLWLLRSDAVLDVDAFRPAQDQNSPGSKMHYIHIRKDATESATLGQMQVHSSTHT
jgi:hypothetical protein